MSSEYSEFQGDAAAAGLRFIQLNENQGNI